MSTVRVFYPRYTRAEVVEALRSATPDLARRLPLRLVALFGSYARGNYSVRSDIDLLVVYDEPRREDAFALVREAIPLPGLEPHCYSASEATSAWRTLSGMLRDAVILLGRSDALSVEEAQSGGGTRS